MRHWHRRHHRHVPSYKEKMYRILKTQNTRRISLTLLLALRDMVVGLVPFPAKFGREYLYFYKWNTYNNLILPSKACMRHPHISYIFCRIPKILKNVIKPRPRVQVLPGLLFGLRLSVFCTKNNFLFGLSFSLCG